MVRTNRRSSVAAALALAPLLLVAGIGCSKSGFSSKNAPASPPTGAAPGDNGKPAPAPTGDADSKKAPEEVFELGCDLEASQGTLATKGKAGAAHFAAVPLSCSKTSTTTSTTEVKDPVDVVFVLDVTDSMGSNLRAVKENVAKFANALATRGWDARFAAVGFRDVVDHTLAFTDSSNLSFGVGQWVAYGGGDTQEAGQDGLRSALQLVAQGARPNAKKAFLLVTDNPFYASASNHSDYSVGALAAQMKSALPADARVFCSVPSYGAFSVAPRAQCDDLRAQSGLGGENFAFPLTAGVMLDQFAARFDVKSTAQTTACSLVKVEIVDASSIAGGGIGVGVGAGGVTIGTGNGTSVTIGAGKVSTTTGMNFDEASASLTTQVPPTGMVPPAPVPGRVSLGDAPAVGALAGSKALRVERCCQAPAAGAAAPAGIGGLPINVTGAASTKACSAPQVKYVRF